MLAATKAVVCAIVNSYLPPFPPIVDKDATGASARHAYGPHRATVSQKGQTCLYRNSYTRFAWDISSHRHEIP
jgi:hypothetical protein